MGKSNGLIRNKTKYIIDATVACGYFNKRVKEDTLFNGILELFNPSLKSP
jgi:hypothetical protein